MNEAIGAVMGPCSTCGTPGETICARCGSYVCAAHARTYDYKPRCPTCFGVAAYATPTSSRARYALGLSLASLIGCFPLGTIGAILGHTELAAIRAGTSPASGRGMALGAVLIGWTSTVAMAALVVLALLLLGLGSVSTQ